MRRVEIVGRVLILILILILIVFPFLDRSRSGSRAGSNLPRDVCGPDPDLDL